MAVVVLLIEDNPDDVALIRAYMRESRNADIELRVVDRLAAAVEQLAEGGIDVVITDLRLPDSTGLDTLLGVRKAAPRTPVVVLTGMDDAVGPAALRAGAQDHLPKARLDRELLVRSIRYSIERQVLLNQLELRQKKEQQARDLELLQAIAGTSDSVVANRAYGARSLREADKDLFTKMARVYGSLLGELVEEGDEVDHLPAAVQAEIDRLAGALAVLGASPRDAVDLHAAAINVKGRLLTADQVSRHVERGRTLLFELISLLASHYREHDLATRDEAGSSRG